MSNLSLLARGSLTALVLVAAVGANAQTQSSQGSTSGTGGSTGAAGSAATPAAGSSATVDAAFKQADVNGDGKLSAEELKAIPALAGRFSDLDKDKDGSVSSAEFAAGVTVKTN